MALSISKSQDNYLKTVHLESIGQDKSGGGPVELTEVEQSLVDLAIVFKATAEHELDIKNAIDTNQLAESIQFDEVNFMGGVYSIDISVLDYYKFVNKGVKGLQGGPASPFSFKNLHVSKAFATSIRKWVIRYALKARTKPAKTHPLGAEKKAVFKDTSNAMAYAIATSIKKKGLKATNFWDKAEQTTQEQVEKTLGNAFAISIVNEIVK